MAQYYEGVGRRKQSTARVRVTSGSGMFLINEKPLDVYFGRMGDMDSILSPFNAVNQDNGIYDVTVKVSGGGVTGHRLILTLQTLLLESISISPLEL